MSGASMRHFFLQLGFGKSKVGCECVCVKLYQSHRIQGHKRECVCLCLSIYNRHQNL